MNRQLIKVDRNGTKYFHVVEPCGKCGGQGYIQYYHWNEGGICFDCNGSGVREYEEKEYTEEYLKKLEGQRKRRQEKAEAMRRAMADGLNKAFYERNGFNADGKAYAVLGDTFATKDELRSNGFRYKPQMGGWYSDKKVDGFDLMEFSAEDAYCTDNCGVLLWNSAKRRFFYQGEEISHEDADACDYWEFNVDYMVKEENTKRNVEKSESGYVGNVGDKISVEVTLVREVACNYSLGWKSVSSTLYIMKDKDGNVFTWKTQGILSFMPKGGEYYKYIDTDYPFTITGKIKDHNEYNGVKQTVLTRCSVFSEHAHE